jgi:hypothetical protein
VKENLFLDINIITSKEQCEEFVDFDGHKGEELEMLSRDSLALIRKEKLLKEIESARKLLEQGIEPLKVADQFFHDTFKIIEQGIIDKNPEFTKEEIKQKVLENINFANKIKSRRKRG